MTRQKIVQFDNGGIVAFQEYGDPNWSAGDISATAGRAHARWRNSQMNQRVLSVFASFPRTGRASAVRACNSIERSATGRRFVERLVDHLSIGEFRILAISGGAPYAYATAVAIPERVRAIAIVGGVIPFAELKDFKGLLPLYRWMLAFYRNRPQLLRRLFHWLRPFLSFRAPIRLRPLFLKMLLLRPCDAASLRDDAAFEAIFESQRRAWRGSAEGVLADARIYAEPWGFAIEDVRVPVRLWHGIEDRAFAVRLAEEIANRLPNCKARFIENEGHYSLPIRHIREILEDLISV